MVVYGHDEQSVRISQKTSESEHVQNRDLYLRLTSRSTIGADFHRAMVATAPGEKLLMGRRRVKLDSLYDIKRVFVHAQKITFVLSKKSTKNCCHQNCTF